MTMGECKIKTTCDDLDNFLSSLSQPSIPSVQILHNASPTTQHHGDSDTLVSSTGTEAYRCKCSFQIIADGNDDLAFVVRENGTICHLPDGIFAPANFRIRQAMKCLINLLNNNKRSDHTFSRLRENLTSATFDTSWNEKECLLTLHYGPPGISQSCLEEWKQEAQIVCDECQFVRVTGRSKGIKLFVSGSTYAAPVAAADNPILEEGIIQDTLWLTLRDISIDDSSIQRVESVSMVQPNQSLDSRCVKIRYQKPATAFQHPNAGVMLTSLHWILNTLTKVSQNADRTKLRLLEMYNGAGTHTIPLAKSMLLSEIIAVELDERLVTACRNNCRLNNCLKGEASDQDQTLVEVFKGDAAEWASKTLRSIHKKNKISKDTTPISNNEANSYNEFDILLVDPPRQGLDATVCEMAIKGTFTQLIYISCGRRALIRDLTLLCTDFDLEDVAVIDLFPGTDAVETLIHLKRK